MSLTARERLNPPPRRKSCAACIKAKRRCDFALPACFRCSQRMIPCEYPSRPSQSRRARLGVQQLSDEISGVPVADDIADAGPAAQLGKGVNVIDGVASSSDFSILPFLDMPESDFSMELTRQSSVLTPPVSKDYSLVAESIARRLQYAIEEIKKVPSVMAYEMQTPWCHPLLYKDGMPRSIEDAFASCAIYMAKTRANAPVVLRSIESRASELLASPTPLTAIENLAHTQSLLLYQIIRIFDGDISARASAERSVPALEVSALGLLSFANWEVEAEAPAELPLYPLGPTKSFWNDWIFQESLRRTLLFTFYFLQLYRLLSGQTGLQCDGKLGLCHSWTISAHLWNAKTPVEFAEAWKERNHFVVTNAQFESILQEAQAHDIDAFGKILISSLLGVDEAEGWFASRGGSLRRVSVGV